MEKKNYEKIIITIVLLVCSISYLSLIWNTNVWMDEAFTGALVNTSFIGVLIRSMMDTLPPLYNIILKLMTDIFGYTTYVMKITSVIPMLATLVLGATKVRKRFGSVSAISFMLCITGMPLMYYYGVEIRMYSLGFFFATASGIYAYELVCDYNRRNLAAFVAFSVLAGYSHHFAFVTVGLVYFFLLVYYFFFNRNNISRWFKSLLLTFIFYLPCLIITLRQFANVSGYFSMPDIDLHLFIQYATYPYAVGVLSASLLCIALPILAIFYVGYRYKKGIDRENDNIYSVICFVIYYCVLLFGTVISKIMTANIFVDRYLFFSTGLLWLFIAIQIGKLPQKVSYILIAILLYIGICSYKVEYRIEYDNSADEEISYLADNVNPGDIFYSVGEHEELDCCFPFLSMLTGTGNELNRAHPLNKALDQINDNSSITLWIAVRDGYELSEDDTQIMNDYGYSLDKAIDCDFDRYKCTLYRVVRK